MPMRTFAQNEPLTDAELDRLGDFLNGCKGGRAMNVEALDGFFSALIAGPETGVTRYDPTMMNRRLRYGSEIRWDGTTRQIAIQEFRDLTGRRRCLPFG